MKRAGGKVYLIGAGPGDPGLLTVRGARLLQKSDAVVYDGLVNPGLLENLTAEKWNVSKSFASGSRRHGTDQGKINRLLVKLAWQGKTVARLKGGDPFIFGRGGEEASCLKKNGITFEVVPGVSAAASVPAYAGIPVTDRRFASSVTLVTCHEDPAKGKSEINWRALAELGGTLVFFMGLKNIESVIGKLILEGRASSTPCCVIEWGTLPRQRVVEGTLKTIAARVARAELRSPALTVVGETAALRAELGWFEQKTLFAKKIIVTRPENQNAELSCLLRERGAEVIECPAIRILPPKNVSALDRVLRDLTPFDWILFTSVNSADFFLKRLRTLKKDSRALSRVKIGAVGETTARFLAGHGLRADLIPGEFHTRALVQALLKKQAIRGKHFLLPRTDIAPPFLKQALEKAGGRVTAVTAYRTVRDARKLTGLREAVRAGEPDFVLLTSASTARHFFNALPRPLRAKIRRKLVSIGPATTEALQQLGLKPLLQAREHTVEGLVRALEAFTAKQRK